MAAAFTPIDGQAEKYLADIFALARMTLSNAGVNKVSGGGNCTVTDARSFYSYRRDKTTGRMASLIWLK
jgi:copper oxidase (laccase) domain-containing protein